MVDIIQVRLCCSRCGELVSGDFAPGQCFSEDSEPQLFDEHDTADTELEVWGEGGHPGLLNPYVMADEINEDPRDEELWCVHVQGPDSLIAMPSKELAEQRATEWNAMFANILAKVEPRKREFYPVMNAVVIPWQGYPWSHATDLARHGGNPEDIC